MQIGIVLYAIIEVSGCFVRQEVQLVQERCLRESPGGVVGLALSGD